MRVAGFSTARTLLRAVVLGATLAVFACSSEGAPSATTTTPTDPSAGQPGAVSPTADAGATTPEGGASGDGAAPEDPGPPAVRFVGRFDTSDPAGPLCAWPGCRIVARFEGTAVSAKLDEKNEDWQIGAPSEWDVTIDGVTRPKLVLQPGVHTYALAKDLAPGPHVVELYKRSEAQNGSTQFLAYDFGAAGKLLPPPLRQKRRIEIVGDSSPAAFGIEGQGPSCGVDQAAKFQNFHKSFGARLGEIFDAELHGTVYSGKSIVRNIWRPDTQTMPVLYGRANPLFETSLFPLASWVPDVIVIMIGGLDFAVGQPYDNGPTPVPEFAAGYATFLKSLRTAYAKTKILAVVSPSTVDYDDRPIRTSVASGVTSAVEQRRADGDSDVFVVSPNVATAAELTGCNGHGNPLFHERVAQELAAVVRAKTGWP